MLRAKYQVLLLLVKQQILSKVLMIKNFVQGFSKSSSKLNSFPACARTLLPCVIMSSITVKDLFIINIMYGITNYLFH